jgi:hypothetical protein
MTKSFKYLLEKLINAIDETNENVIENMIGTEYPFSCVKQNVTYEMYYTMLSSRWNKIIDEVNSDKDNNTSLAELNIMKKFSEKNNISSGSFKSSDDVINNVKSYFIKFLDESNVDNEVIRDQMFDVMADLVMTDDIYMNTNIMTTILNLGNFIKTRSVYWIWDFIIVCVSSKIKAEFAKYDKNLLEHKKQVVIQLRSYFYEIKSMLQLLNKDMITNFFNKILETTSNNLTKSYEMSKVESSNSDSNTNFIENELSTMIPESIGPLKCFFIDLIQYYYSSEVLHPIIWAQILRAMLVNFLINPPMSQTELFQFFSKHLLLNSGPFILKILQQVRPFMSVEQRRKYNLDKLTYPKMTESQYKLILGKIVKNWDLYKIINDASASVGHVFFVQHSITMEKFVVKIAKPLSIMQSCYEYSKLNTFFDMGTLEQRFVHNMLYSTGKEMQSKSEIENINLGNKLYTMKYNELYSDVNINASLTTITVKENIIVDNCWFALTMTIAEGIPLSKLIESEGKSKLDTDTPYRAYLHRCFDLVIYKFFSNIIKSGFYHGDLHAGNVYFSFTDGPERKAEITLIDFGAVGTLDIFNNDPDINELIKIIIQSIFYNYDNLFETLVDLLNKKSIGSTSIDKSSEDYKTFKNKLKKIKVKNIYRYNKNAKMYENYTKSCINNDTRVQNENSLKGINIKPIIKEKKSLHARCYNSPNNLSNNVSNENIMQKTSIDSLYDLVDIHNMIKEKSKTKENTEYTEPLPAYDCDFNPSNDIVSFTEVMNMINQFCAKSNVNIPITIPDLNDLFKAYALVNGLAGQINYESLRMGNVIKKILYDYENIENVVKHPVNVLNMYNIYVKENKNYNKVLEKISKLDSSNRNIDLD